MTLRTGSQFSFSVRFSDRNRAMLSEGLIQCGIEIGHAAPRVGLSLAGGERSG